MTNFKNFITKMKAKKSTLPIIGVLVIAALSTVIYLRLNTIAVVIDGQSTSYKTFKTSVETLLKEENIVLGEKDKIEPALSAKLRNNDKIIIKRAFNIKLAVDGNDKDILTSEDSVNDIIKSEHIALREADKINPSLDSKLSKDMKIEIVRVDSKTIVDSTAISFNTTVKTSSSMPNTQKKVVQEGKEGERQIKTLITLENGKEVARQVLSDTITKKPVDKIVVQGTYPLMPVNRGGDPIPYKRVFQARATAYSAIHGIGKTYTASGRLAVRNPEGYSTIAVDPTVLPYGTKVFIEGYGFAIAADCGSAIKGNKIDVFFNYRSEALKWAVKHVNVYVLK
jgi:uncharacterized protein YabE (DUF348 family)